MITQKRSLRLLEAALADPYDIIVVPGVPYNAKGMSILMKKRIYWSKYLYDRGATKNVIYSGGAVHTPYCESKIMASAARELGIPEGNIYIETRAEHSTENIYYSYKKAKLLGFTRIALASNPFQVSMLERFIKKNVANEIGFIPFVVDLLKTVNHSEVSIDSSAAYEPHFVSIIERKSWWQRLNGTRGLNINKSYYSNKNDLD